MERTSNDKTHPASNGQLVNLDSQASARPPGRSLARSLFGKFARFPIFSLPCSQILRLSRRFSLIACSLAPVLASFLVSFADTLFFVDINSFVYRLSVFIGPTNPPTNHYILTQRKCKKTMIRVFKRSSLWQCILFLTVRDRLQ